MKCHNFLCFSHDRCRENGGLFKEHIRDCKARKTYNRIMKAGEIASYAFTDKFIEKRNKYHGRK